MAYENLYTRIDVDLKKRLDEHVFKNKTTIQAVVTEALDEYLQKHDPQGLRPRGK